MWLAIDTATDRLSVAVGAPGAVLARQELAGARKHAAMILPLLDRCLDLAGRSVGEMEGVILADGPGSFTGLRVGATVAKALVADRGLPLWVTPSLLGSAALAGSDGQLTMAVSDALRGEFYAGLWRVRAGEVETVADPVLVTPDHLPTLFRDAERVVGPAASRFGAPAIWPDAGALIGLVGRFGGATLVAEPSSWEPNYGRPAEAQVKWEARHGRPLPDPARHSS